LAWSVARRRRFLFLDETPTPLSVDRAVWPSVLEEAARAIGPCGLALAPPAAGEGDGGAVLAVSLVRDASRREEEERVWLPRMLEVEAAPEASWTLLGYDVVDVDATSALTNCGYDEDERAELRSSFGPSLDPRTHLFRDLAAARRFSARADARVPEHAPFGVVAVRLRSNRDA